MDRIDLPALVQALQEHEQTADHALVSLHVLNALPLTDPEHAIVNRLIGLYTTRRDACARIIALVKALASAGFPEASHDDALFTDDVPPPLQERLTLFLRTLRAGAAPQEV